MKQIAATHFERLLQQRDQILEAVGIEWFGIEQEKSKLADHVASTETGKDGVRLDGREDLGGVVVENGLEEFRQACRIGGLWTKESGGAGAIGEMFGRGVGREPKAFAKNIEDIVRRKEIFSRRMWLDVTEGRHARSLARMSERRCAQESRKGRRSALGYKDTVATTWQAMASPRPTASTPSLVLAFR